MKPIDPSPTPWDYSTWGYYCDDCEKFLKYFEVEVLTHEGNTCSYRHEAFGHPLRYIGYDHTVERDLDNPNKP